jgi:CRISPR/Cas system-associated protein Cas5 (RAMP superfamily)
MEETLRNFSLELEILKKEIDDYAYKTKANFNVFDALTRHHLEELHSNFIAYLLDPDAGHYCEKIFLKCLINTLKKKSIHIDEINNITVEREHVINEIDIDGRIDIYIEGENFIVAIENKIYAAEQKDQIDRYYKYCQRKGKPFIVIYLTIDGSESSEAKNVKEYIRLSYRKDIIDWLNYCMQKVEKYTTPYQGINFYKNILEKSILMHNHNLLQIKKILEDKKNNSIIQNSKLLREILDNIYWDYRKKYFSVLYKKLDEKYSCVPIIAFEDQAEIDLISESYRGGIKIIGKEYVYEKEETKICFAIEHDFETIYYGLALLDKNNVYVRYDDSNKNQKKIIEVFKSNIQLKKADKDWFAWNYFKFKNYNSDNFTADLMHNLENIIDNTIKEIEPHIEIWRKAISHHLNK